MILATCDFVVNILGAKRPIIGAKGLRVVRANVENIREDLSVLFVVYVQVERSDSSENDRRARR